MATGSGRQDVAAMPHLISGFFNPDEQVKKFDPEHRYLRRWLPEMAGGNYPQPTVEHSFARDRALKTYKEALT